MIVPDVDLATLEAPDLAAARERASGLVYTARRLAEPSLGRVAASLLASLDMEAASRAAWRQRGAVRLTVDAFEDDHPDDAERSRIRVVGYLQIVRDDHDQRPAVRELFADLMVALSDPSPVARQVELARLDRLTSPRTNQEEPT